MKFSTATLATILLAAIDTSNASSSVPTVRGGRVKTIPEDASAAAWSTTHFGTTHTHRHLEQGNSDCLLVERDTQFEDHQERIGVSSVWVCEFSFAVAQSRLNGRIFIDIDQADVPKEVMDGMNAQSGASILRTTGAYIEETLDTGAMKMHIPPTASMEVVSIDSVHDSQHSRRRLASPNPGTLSVLVIKVIDSVGAQIDATNAQLYDDIFDDEYSLKTGYESCSNDQLIIEPAANRNDGESGVVDGITTVVLDIEAEDDNDEDLRNAAIDKATEEYGDVSSQYDLVMLCLPRTSDFVAYAYINSWLSVYNDYWCQRVSAQMHEVGHNLGFAHSNENGESYKDQSGMMGYSYNQDDGPKMCFNAPKNFQTGWYTNAQESFYPLENKNSMVERRLVGIDDYQVSGNNNGNLVTLRLGDDDNDASNSNGDDYYIGFNLKDGINEGTLEGADQVIIFRKQAGGPTQYGESDRVADLNSGDSYTIQGFKGTSFDVTIRVKSFENNDRTAPIEIITGTPGPITQPPTSTPDPSFENLGSGYCRDSAGQYNGGNWDTNSYCVDLPACQAECKAQDRCVGVAWALEPTSDTDTVCGPQSLPRCVVYYGMTAPVVVVEKASEVPEEYTAYRYKFPIVSPPTLEPTPEPTPGPTPQPTLEPTPEPTLEPTVFDDVDFDILVPSMSPTNECPADSTGVVYKKKLKCKKLKKKKNKKIKKICKKSYKVSGTEVQVYDSCPTTCGKKAGLGQCSYLSN